MSFLEVDVVDDGELVPALVASLNHCDRRLHAESAVPAKHLP